MGLTAIDVIIISSTHETGSSFFECARAHFFRKKFPGFMKYRLYAGSPRWQVGEGEMCVRRNGQVLPLTEACSYRTQMECWGESTAPTSCNGFAEKAVRDVRGYPNPRGISSDTVGNDGRVVFAAFPGFLNVVFAAFARHAYRPRISRMTEGCSPALSAISRIDSSGLASTLFSLSFVMAASTSSPSCSQYCRRVRRPIPKPPPP